MREVSTFAAVGVAATLTHLVVAWLAHGFGFSPQGANFLGWFVAVGVSFLGHARLTFRVGGPLFPYLPRFLLLSGVAFILSAAIIAFCEEVGLPFWTGLAMVGLTIPPASYAIQRTAVFHDMADAPDPGVLVAATAGLGIFAWFRDAYVNHDVAWYLVAGRQWMEGARLYTDLSEVNPPLAFYLTRLTLVLADLLSLADPAALAAFVALLTAVVIAWFARHVPNGAPHRVPLIASVSLATVLPFLGHFGQREHLMFLFILPWAASALFDENPLGGKGAILRGLVAGIGICLKPHFLVFPLAVTAAEAVRQRSLRPILSAGNLAMGSIGLAYVILVSVLHREYFTIIIPDARLVYGAYALPFALQVANLAPIPVGSALIVLLAARKSRFGATALVLCLAAIAAFVLQGNGFTYHAAPIHAFALIGLAGVATQAARPLCQAALVTIVLVAGNAVVEGGYRNPLSERLEARLQDLGLQPRRLLVWSTSLLPAFPLTLQANAEWTGHAASLWLLPGTLDLVDDPNADTDPRNPVRLRQQSLMARDLGRCPDIVILDRVLPFQEKPLDLRAYLDPRTRLELDRNYTLRDSGRRFDILVRVTPCAS